MLSVILFNLAAVVVFMVCIWLLSVVIRDASIVDIFWGLGFVLLAWLTFIRADGYLGRKILVSFLVTVWGLRLAIHIFLRNHGKGEDPRYVAMRERHGDRFWYVSLVTVFMLQAVLLWIVSLVAQVSQISPVPARFTWFDVAGTMVWGVGFFFESIGDWELKEFLKNPANKGKVMDKGLWAYTRHPNYFGESLIWWGMFLFALSSPANLWTIVSPLVITFLLLKVSGVTLTEESMATEHSGYDEYVNSTSAFIPWFPKKRRKAV
jgi:steroid 5-alpha reductase family enzyme